jgi:PBP1b-binding outer membrane lipoprotein LpoB
MRFGVILVALLVIFGVMLFCGCSSEEKKTQPETPKTEQPAQPTTPPAEPTKTPETPEQPPAEGK